MHDSLPELRESLLVDIGHTDAQQEQIERFAIVRVEIIDDDFRYSIPNNRRYVTLGRLRGQNIY